MRKPRTQRRRTNRVQTVVSVALLLLVLSFAFGAGWGATASFTTGRQSRAGAVDVTADETAAFGLGIADSVHINSTDPLVNVTNELGQSVTVSVTLDSESEHIGDLVVDGNTVGNSTSFELAEAQTETVSIEIPDDDTLTSETVYFSASGSGSGLTVSAKNRSVPVNG